MVDISIELNSIDESTLGEVSLPLVYHIQGLFTFIRILILIPDKGRATCNDPFTWITFSWLLGCTSYFRILLNMV